MDKRRKYFIKQKIWGGVLIILSLIAANLTSDGMVALLLIPLGFYMIFTKKMVWMDDYFFETKFYGSEKEEESSN